MAAATTSLIFMHRQRNWHVELQQAKYDAERTRELEQRGLKVWGFRDRQALLQTESVLEAIFQAVKNPS